MLESKRKAADAFGNRTSTAVEESDDLVRPAYQRARERSDERLMLKFRFANGRSVSLAYSYLTQVDHDPGDVLRLRFGRLLVTVTGRRMERIADDLLEHRVRLLQEGTETEDGLRPAETPHIDSISIQTDEGGV